MEQERTKQEIKIGRLYHADLRNGGKFVCIK